MFAAASENRTHLNSLDARGGNSLRVRFGHRFFAVFCDDDFARRRIDNVVNRESAEKSGLKRLDLLVAFADLGNPNAGRRSAVVVSDDDILRNIDKSSCEVAGVGGTKRRVRLSFTRTSRGYEIFKNGKSFTEVRSDGNFDRFTCRVRHKSAHTAKLTDLVDRSARARNSHHVDRVLFAQVFLKFFGYGGCRAVPNGNYLAVFLLVGDHASLVKFLDFCDFLFGLSNDALFLGRNDHIRYGYGDSRLRRILIALSLDRVKDFGCSGYTVNADGPVNDLSECLFRYDELDLGIEHAFGVVPVNKSEILRNGVVEDQKSDGGQNILYLLLSVNGLFHADHDRSVYPDRSRIISDHRFIDVSERFSSLDGFAVFVEFNAERIVLVFLDSPCSRFVVADDRQIERSEDHVLSRNCDGLSVLRTEKVICGKHEESCLCLRFR